LVVPSFRFNFGGAEESAGFVSPSGVVVDSSGVGCRRFRVGRPGALGRRDAMRAPRCEADARVCRDGEEPAAEGTSPFKTADPLPRSEQRLLQRIIGIRDAPEQAIAMGVERSPLRGDQLLKRSLVASSGGVDQPSFVAPFHGGQPSSGDRVSLPQLR
jgi:hypothetical protein